MGQKAKREDIDKQLEKQVALQQVSLHESWFEEFRTPAYYGEFVNQVVLPLEKVEMIPKGFRTALPTKQIAELWGKND